MNHKIAIAAAASLGASLVLLFAGPASAQDLQPPPPMDSSQPAPPPPQQQPPPPQQTQPPPPQGAPQQPYPQQTQPYPSQPQDLQPPPPSSSNPPPPSTEQRLDDAKKEDSGRGLEFLYINAQGGYAFDALQSLSPNNPLQMQNTDVGGPMLGAEAGIRLLFFTLGMRFRYELLQPFNIWQLNVVAGFHVQSGKWDPYVSIHGGFSAIGNINQGNVSGTLPSGLTSQDIANDVSTKGGNVGLGFGVDYYLVRFLSVGIDGAFEFIFLHRDPLQLPGVDPALANQFLANNPAYQNSGDAAGLGFSVSAHLGLHL